MNTQPPLPPPLVQTTTPQPPSAGPPPMTPPASRACGPDDASLVLGISGLVLVPLGLLFGLPGFILGLIGLKKKTAGKGVAIAGMVCSGIAVLLSSIFLVGWLVPAIYARKGVPLSAKVALNGSMIVMSITDINYHRTAMMLDEVWPRKGKWENSNAYFARLMGDDGNANLTLVPISAFAGGVVDPAADMDALRRGGNVWTILAGIDTCNNSRMPFLWTSNLRLTQADLEDYVRDPYAERSLAHRLDPSVEPFGDDCVVMITKGAKTFTIRASDLTTKTFFGGALPEDVDLLEIVEPRASGTGAARTEELVSATRTTISSIESAASAWETRHFKKPDSLDRLLEPDGDREPLLPAKVRTDAWGNEIQFRLNGRRMEIRSAGPDGRMNTSDDVTN